MATLKLNIDSSGAEDGARKFADLLQKIAKESEKLTKSLMLSGNPIAEGVNVATRAYKLFRDQAVQAYADVAIGQGIHIAKLKLEEEALKKVTSARDQFHAIQAKYDTAADIASARKLKNYELELAAIKRLQSYRAVSALGSAHIGSDPGFDAAAFKSKLTKAYALDSLFQANYSGAGVRNQIKEIGEAAQKGSGLLYNFKKSWIGVASQLGLGLTAVYAVRRGITETIGTISAYEKQLDILGAVSGATAEEQKELASTARAAGAGGMFSANENALALTELAKAGFTAKEAMAALNGTMAFAINAQISIGQAADISSKIIRQFNLDAGDSLRVIDALTNVANKTVTTVENLSNALKFVGPAAHSLGIDIETTAAALGTLARSGVDASLAGTGLRRILTELGSLTPQATKRLEAMGVALDKINPKNNKLVDIFKELKRAHLDLNSARVIFDQRSAVSALVLAEYSDKLEELITFEREHGGIALKNAAIISDNLAGAWTRLGNTMKEVALGSGDAGGLSAMRVAVEALNDTILVLTGNWRLLRGSWKDNAVFNVRDLRDQLKEVADSSPGATMELEKVKASLIGIRDALSLAKPDTRWVNLTLEDLAKIDVTGSSSATAISKSLIKVYSEALAKAQADFNKSDKFLKLGQLFDPGAFARDSKLLKPQNIHPPVTEIQHMVEQMLAGIQKELDASKPLEIQTPRILDYSVLLDVRDEALDSQQEKLDRAIDSVKEQRLALEDGTAALKAQNAVRAMENSLLEDQKQITKRLDKVQKEINDATEGVFAEKLKKLREEIDLELTSNKNAQEKLSIFRQLLISLYRAKEIQEASARFDNRLESNAINQRAHLEDLQTELAALKVSNTYREQTVRLAREQTDAYKEYYETVKLIHEGDLEAHEKYAQANADLEERIRLTKQLTEAIIAQEKIENLATSMSESFGAAFEDILTGTESVSDAMENMVRDIQRQLLHELFTKQLSSAMFNMFQSLLGGVLGGSWNGLAPGVQGPPASASAFGNTFGTNEHYAQGGIINRLGRIPTNRGSAIVGEQGPEGILPLARGRDGRLGVRMIGQDMPNMQASQTSTVNKTANVTVYAKDSDSFKRTQKQIASDLRRRM